jgi:peptidase, M24 family
MSKSTLPRLKALRDEMGKAGITAFIIPGTDPHQSEYYASHWAARTWISGFDGSAGTAVVTTNQAGLWTDSRYFLQAAQQLEDSGFELFKEGLPDTPTIEQWLLTTLPQGATIAIDGTLFGASKAAAMKQNFESHGFRFVSDFTPFDSIWEKRPSIPKNEAFIHDEKYSGESISDKIARIMEQVRQAGADALLLAALDEIAWAFNIRGTDVECNPVVICYAYIDDSQRILFIDKAKINDTVCQYLQKNSVEIMPYENIFDFVATLPAEKKVFVDTNKINYTLLNKLHAIPVSGQSPIALLKSIKNETQLAGTREAMIRDGVALVRFFRWLEKNIDSGKVTEITVAEKLREFRSQQSLYVGESFATIAGFNEHGAIVHYSATPESNAIISRKGFLLIDSGAQYLDGTTDITRTVSLGNLSPRQKRDFTLVMKGHIALATCHYPQGTHGAQLDALARHFLWDDHLNYLHGTGHGVGHFLNVHEGPQNIRLEENPTPLMPGMITSNEPGLYRTGEYGIRCENLVLTVPDYENEFGMFYRFETLTLFPFDTEALDISIMTEKEIEWLNSYHEMVYDRLSPMLDEEEQQWLHRKTTAI